MEEIGGVCVVESRPGGVTAIRLDVPLPEKEATA
jgi:hypothetical protein